MPFNVIKYKQNIVIILYNTTRIPRLKVVLTFTAYEVKFLLHVYLLYMSSS